MILSVNFYSCGKKILVRWRLFENANKMYLNCTGASLDSLITTRITLSVAKGLELFYLFWKIVCQRLRVFQVRAVWVVQCHARHFVFDIKFCPTGFPLYSESSRLSMEQTRIRNLSSLKQAKNEKPTLFIPIRWKFCFFCFSHLTLVIAEGRF